MVFHLSRYKTALLACSIIFFKKRKTEQVLTNKFAEVLNLFMSI